MKWACTVLHVYMFIFQFGLIAYTCIHVYTINSEMVACIFVILFYRPAFEVLIMFSSSFRKWRSMAVINTHW